MARVSRDISLRRQIDAAVYEIRKEIAAELFESEQEKISACRDGELRSIVGRVRRSELFVDPPATIVATPHTAAHQPPRY